METLILSSLWAMFNWTVSTRSGGYYHSFSGAVLFQIFYYIKKMAVNLLTTKISLIRQLAKWNWLVNMYRAFSTWKFTIYYLLRQKNHGKHQWLISKLEANLFISGDVVSKSSRPTFCFHSGRRFSWEKLVRLSENVSCYKQVLAFIPRQRWSRSILK